MEKKYWELLRFLSMFLKYIYYQYCVVSKSSFVKKLSMYQNFQISIYFSFFSLLEICTF